MNKTYGVWAMVYTPEWLAENAGVPDMRITIGQSLHDAYYAAERIRMISGDDVQVDIRDHTERNIVTVREVREGMSGTPVLHIVDIHPRPEQTHERKARRALGKGAQR